MIQTYKAWTRPRGNIRLTKFSISVSPGDELRPCAFLFCSQKSVLNSELVRRNVLRSIVSLEVTKGHLKWRVADVARLSKVTRPLIYYHFGKSKIEILQKAIELLGVEYFGLDHARRNSLGGAGAALDSLRRTRKMFLETPALAVFYQRWRMQDSPLRQQLIDIERRYQTKIHEAFPQLSADEILAFHALLHGVITAPFLSESAFDRACEAIFLWVRGR